MSEAQEVACQECGTRFIASKPTGNGQDIICPLCSDLIVEKREDDDDQDYPLDRGD